MDKKIKIDSVLPYLADASVPDVVHHMSRVPEWAWNGMAGRTDDWSKVTCGSCKLERPAEKPKEYVVPADVLERDRAFAEQVRRNMKQDGAFVTIVYAEQREHESFGQARQRVLDSLHAEALLEDAQRAPGAWLKNMAVRSEKLALLGEERQMQRKIDQMIDDLCDLREKSGLRASRLEKEIRELS